MAQLVNMRQRIKTIETIKKVTNAMRLISMSSHNQLKNKKGNLEDYINAINKITFTVKKAANLLEKNNKINESNYSDKILIILIGTDKGLVGNFNTQLFKLLNNINFNSKYKYYYIGIGKFAVNYLKEHNKNIIAQYNQFNSKNFLDISNEISNNLLENLESYKRIISFSNKSKSFFIQQSLETILFPIQKIKSKFESTFNISDYIWEQNPKELYKKLKELQFKNNLQQVLFNSLLAEQSARFLSMDSSTRNAESLLNTMKIEYNKARQAVITKELIELTGGFIV